MIMDIIGNQMPSMTAVIGLDVTGERQPFIGISRLIGVNEL